MLPDASLSPAQKRIESAVPAQWRAPLSLLIFAWAGLSLLFARDWADMAGQWWDSSTYNHILLVPPILFWLVWLRKGELARLTPSAWWPGLILLAGALFVWLLGAMSGLNTARHLGLVASLSAAAIALLGPRVTAALAFPLAYAAFLVPVGDEFVPALQMATAKITIALTQLSGVPATIDGVFIDTPAGLFEVAEACSGVKFLVAMIALGVLVCHLCFRSWWRRAGFMALAIAVPILANGVRAWGTIYIAQSQGVEFAAGFDHIVYGWVFFAVVIAILLGLSWRFFDRPASGNFVDVEAIEGSPLLKRMERYRMAGGAGLLAILGLGLGTALWAASANKLSVQVPREIALPDVAGWQLVDYAPDVRWEPRASGAGHRLLGRYRDASGRNVDVFYAFYSAQREGSEAGAHGEGALPPGGSWRWVESRPAMDGGLAERLQADTANRRLVVTWYRNGEILTGSIGRLKLAVMADRFALTAEPTMMLILSTEERAGTPAGESIRTFLSAVGPLGEWMDGIARLP
jgi:exosortase A